MGEEEKKQEELIPEPPEFITLKGEEFELHGLAFDDLSAIKGKAKKDAMALLDERLTEGSISQAQFDRQSRQLSYSTMTETEINEHNWSRDGQIYLLWRSIRHNESRKNITLKEIGALVDFSNFAEVSNAVTALYFSALKNVPGAKAAAVQKKSD